MPWTMQVRTVYDAYGKPHQKSVKVWVADAKPAAKPKDSAADDQKDRNAALAAAAKVKADAYAKKMAAEAAQRAARTALYKQAQERAKTARAELTVAAAKSRNIDAPTVADLTKAKNTVAAKAAQAANTARWTGVAAKAVKDQRNAGWRAAIKAYKPGDVQGAKTLERILAEARAAQKASGGTDLDTEFVKEWDAAYAKHVAWLNTQFDAFNKRMAQFYTVGKDGKWKAKTEADGIKGYKEYQKPEYQALLAESKRLYGKDGKSGVLTSTYGLRKEMGTQQAEYLYNIASKKIAGQVDSVMYSDPKRYEKADKITAKEITDDWNKNGRFLDPEYSEIIIRQIDPKKTSFKTSVDKNGKTVMVRRTQQEEYDHLQAEYRATLIAERAKVMENQAKLREKITRTGEAKVFDTSQERSDQSMIADAVRETGVDNPKTSFEREKLVNKAMEAWDAKNRRMFLPDGYKIKGQGTMGEAPDARYAEYKKARDAAEKRMYATLGVDGAPSWLDRAATFGPVDAAFKALQSGVGAIGAATKYGATALTGTPAELMAERRNYTVRDLPYSVQKEVKTLADQIYAKNKDVVVGTMGQKYTYEAAIEQATEQVSEAWFKTPAGTKYAAENNLRRGGIGINTGQNTEDKTRLYDELKTFYQKYNVEGFGTLDLFDPRGIQFKAGKMDPMAVLDALSSEYAQNPFSPKTPAILNLAFQIAMDPTNAIPMKATTWLARARYARDATEGLNPARRIASGFKEGITVTEPELRFKRELQGAVSQFAKTQDIGQVADDLLAQVAGIAEKPAARQRLERELRRLGIDPRAKDGKQLMALAEDAITKRFADAHVNFRSVSDHVKEQAEEAKRLAAADNATRRQAQIAADALAAQKEQTAEVVAKTGAAQAHGARMAETDALRARAAREAARPPAPAAAAPPASVAQQSAARGDFQPHATTPGHTDPAIQEIIRRDPVVAVISRDNPHVLTATRTDAGAAPIGRGSSVDIHHDVEFAPGAYGKFAETEEGKAAIAVLDNPRAGLKRKADARAMVYEAGRRSTADKIAALESGGVSQLRGGRIAYDRGGPLHGTISPHQYIADAADTAARRGAASPGEAMLATNEAVAFEEVRRKFVGLVAKMNKGLDRASAKMDAIEAKLADPKIATDATRPHLEAELDALEEARRKVVAENVQRIRDEVRTYAVPRLAVDKVGEGVRMSAEDLAADHAIRMGDLLVRDAMENGTFNVKLLDGYYQTLSLLPGHGITKGRDVEAATGLFLDAVMEPFARRSMTREALADELLRGGYMDAPGSPRVFREQMKPLFALFHLSNLDGTQGILRLSEYSKTMHQLLDADPMNVYARAWMVMETRAGLAWAGPFHEVESAFKMAAVRSGTLHPNLALAMIPYGPMARYVPIRHGWSQRLAGMATSTAAWTAAAPASWNDGKALKYMAGVIDGVMDRKPLIGAAALRRSAQVMDYMVKRYGDQFRRASFSDRAIDGAIWRAFGARGADAFSYGMHDLKAEFVDAMDARFFADTGRHNRENIAKSFDLMFSKDAKRYLDEGKRVQFSDDVRDVFSDLYWQGRISHDNPALHTLQFMMELQRPGFIQKGSTWKRYAKMYVEHMKKCDALADAEEVLKGIFARELYNEAGDAWEAVHGMGNAVHAAGGTKGFFEELGMLPAPRRVVSEARARDLKLLAEEDAALEAKRLEWAQDGVLLKAKDTDEAYAAGSMDEALAKIERGHELLMGREADGTVGLLNQTPALINTADNTAKIVKKPAQARIAAAVKWYRKRNLATVRDVQKADAELASLGADVAAWARHEIHIEDARTMVLDGLSSMVHSTLNEGSLTVEAEEQLRRAVELLDALPSEHVERVLAVLQRRTGYDLWSSRLSKYLEHEDYFGGIIRRERKDEIDARAANSFVKERETTPAMAGKPVVTVQPAGRLDMAPAPHVYRHDPSLVPGAEAAAAAAPPTGPRLLERMDALDAAERAAPVGPPPTASMPGVALPPPPSPISIQTPRVTAAQRALEILSGMTEEQWLARERVRAQRAMKTAVGRDAKRAAFERMKNVDRALMVIKVTKTKGTYINWASRANFSKKVVSVAGDRAVAAFSPSLVSPYVSGAGGALVEQGRAEYRILQTAPVDPGLGKVEMLGDVSKVYTDNRAELDAMFDGPIDKALLKSYGIGEEVVGDVSALDIITGIDELADSMARNRNFYEFVNRLQTRMDARCRLFGKSKGVEGYSLTQFLDDRLLGRADHYESLKFEADELGVAKAIEEARGFKRSTLTDLRGRTGFRASDPIAEVLDRDLRVILAKNRKLKELGRDPHQYNEARKVLRKPLVRKRTSQSLVRQASAKAFEEMKGLTDRIAAEGYETVWREVYDKHFDAIRAALAAKEAKKKLAELAGGRMYGSKAGDIADEFEALYGPDMAVRGFEPAPISLFQKRTLEAAVSAHLGISDPNDPAQIIEGLSRFGQRPPFENRAKMKEWLTKYGFWSPRTGEAIEAMEKKSWSMFEEAEYYRTNWGFVPEWADPELLKEGGKYEMMLHDSGFRGHMHREWGLFDRNMEARMASVGESREEIIRNLVNGNESRGMKAKRDLPLERRYVIERYGNLVTDEHGNLTAFPELMNREEMRAYMVSRATKSIKATNLHDGMRGIGEALIQTQEEWDVVDRLISERVGKFVDEFAMTGKAATYEDAYTMATNVVIDLLKDPVWAKRGIDKIGGFLKLQAKLRRLLVFSQIGFATTNIIDSGIKGSYEAFITRSFRRGPLSAEAASLRAADFGWDRGTQLLREADERGVARIRQAASNGLSARAVAAIGEGVAEMPAVIAGAVETNSKLALARSLYDGAMETALKSREVMSMSKDVAERRVVADAIARKWIAEEVGRLWPSAGDGPIERLFNMISPFISYQAKNRMVFISEAMAHPAIFNYLDHIGDYIEIQNREQWVKDHPDDPYSLQLPENRARLIELPWAKGVYIDLGTFTDASRGLSPAFKALAGQERSYRDMISDWVRLVGPNEQNIIGSILNYMEIPMRTGHKPILDAFGNITGYEIVDIPWTAPWGPTADWANSIWVVDLWRQFESLNSTGKGLTVQDVTLLVGKLAFMGGLKTYDKGAGLNEFFWAMNAKDPEAAKKWLNETADGQTLSGWWLDRRSRTVESFLPGDIKDILDPPKDRGYWFKQPQEWRDRVKAAREGRDLLMKAWDKKIGDLTPGTPEYSQAKKDAQMARYIYYRMHPELIEDMVLDKTPAEWAKMLDNWALDDTRTTYFNIKAPNRDDFKTYKEYWTARNDWKAARVAFLKAHPALAADLAKVKFGLEGAWAKVEEGWSATLDRIGTRGIAQEAAKQAKDYDLLDQIYLMNELDYEALNRETAVNYFNPESDYGTLPKGVQGPAAPLAGMISRVAILPDFGKYRFDRMGAAEKAEYSRSQKYAAGMKEVIAAAKAGGGFDAATFVREMKAHPWLMREYFARNPGKEAKWQANDAYIGVISKYGILCKQGKFDEAARYFDSMPAWAKDRYFSKHPERRQKMQQNLAYNNLMKKWTDHYRRRDYEGGAAYFEKLPQWAKDRYYAKNPNGFGKGTGGSSPYSKAMGKWVKLLQDGKKDEAKAYFDSMPEAFRKRYYAKHPDQELRNDIKRTGQLGKYFAADDAGRAAYLAENPEFATWLKKNDTGATKRTMMIQAAYNALPKEDSWLRRLFREKYPEVFSQQAKGEASLRTTYGRLAEHPEMEPGFEKWVKAIWASYAEELKHTGTLPLKMIEADHSRVGGQQRRPQVHSRADWVRLHTAG